MEKVTYHPLGEQAFSESQDDLRQRRPIPFPFRRKSTWIWLLSSLCILLAVSDVIFVVILLHKDSSSIFTDDSKYSGVEETSQWRYHMWKTEYSGDNDTRSDSLWSSIRPARGVVALDHEWAVDHSLPRAQDFLGDPSKGLYIIDAYHQLHCLIVIRNSLNEFRRGIPQSLSFVHPTHCLDSLRQAVICRADDTPFYTTGDFTLGDGQMRKCRDWKVLSEWTKKRFPFPGHEPPEWDVFR